MEKIGLQERTNCNLFGWGGVTLNPRRDSVAILSPQSCDENLPRIFCSNFESASDRSCTASRGSPLVCDGNSIAGMLISDGTCTTTGVGNHLRYHSISDYIVWMQNVVNGKNPDDNNPDNNPIPTTGRFIVNVVHYSPGNSPTVRCSGTIITSEHVLTTASCTIVPASLQVGIQTETSNGLSTGE